MIFTACSSVLSRYMNNSKACVNQKISDIDFNMTSSQQEDKENTRHNENIVHKISVLSIPWTMMIKYYSCATAAQGWAIGEMISV